MKGKIMKKIVPISIVFLFLAVAFAPGISAEDTADNSQLLTVWLPGVTEDNYAVQKELDQESIDIIEEDVEDFLGQIEIARSPESPGGEIITVEEWAVLKVSICEIIYTVKDIIGISFPDFNVEDFAETIILSILNPFKWFMRSGIISIGRGFAWIPFYDYEQFLGLMIRPIFVTHMLGFSSMLHFNLLPPRVEYADRLGLYRYCTIGFMGLFLNIGDIGRENFVGPVLLIGRGFNFMGKDWP